MIDAATFANSYNAFWQTFTPTCEHFVRWLNLNGLERFTAPMSPSGTAKRRALIAEYAFSLFVEKMNDAKLGTKHRSTSIVDAAAWDATEIRLAPYVAQGLDLSRTFNEEEAREIDEIAKGLVRFFAHLSSPLVLRPVFSGCGFLDASEGDVISGDTIYEVKTVDRPIRSNDIRQTITYAALNFASENYIIKSIGLFNPRRGQFCNLDLEQVSAEISGRPVQDLLSSIVDAVSGSGISR